MSEPSGRALLVGAEGCGHGDDDLGFQIMASLLQSLVNRDDKPAAIILWNTAVRMVAEDSPLLPHLKRLEEEGVNILAGRLCVSQLGLTDKIAVGKVATMGDILDIILHYDVVGL